MGRDEQGCECIVVHTNWTSMSKNVVYRQQVIICLMFLFSFFLFFSISYSIPHTIIKRQKHVFPWLSAEQQLDNLKFFLVMAIWSSWPHLLHRTPQFSSRTNVANWNSGRMQKTHQGKREEAALLQLEGQAPSAYQLRLQIMKISLEEWFCQRKGYRNLS